MQKSFLLPDQSIEVVEKIFFNKMQKTTRRGGFQPPTPSKGRVNAIGTILKSKYSFLKNVEKNTKKKKKSMLTLNKDYILNTIWKNMFYIRFKYHNNVYHTSENT